MRLRYEGTVREGRAVDCRDLDVPAATVVAAIRGADAPVVVEAPEPRPVHERVGYVRPDGGVSIRAALAAAARSRGLTAPQDERIVAVREELSELSVPEASTRAARRAVAERTGDVERLRERVATLRGRVQALREHDGDAEAVAAELSAATRDLSEAETGLIAARERLDAATDAAREVRDARERRLRLRDRLHNRRREARAHLADALADEFRTAVAATPWPTPSDPREADDVTRALAVGRIAALRAPVGLACDRFADPATAADWLDAAVIRL